MHSVLFYIVSLGSLMIVAGSVIAFFALRHAPEGYENEQEGFVGLTKGDERLLNEFAAFKAQAMQQMGHAHHAA